MSEKTVIPAIPTLHARSTPLITKKEDVAIYLIRWFFVNPGDTSSVHEGEMISFRKLNAKYSEHPNELADRIGVMMTEAIRRYFPEDNLSCQCQIKEEDGYGEDGTYQGRFVIEIQFVNENGEALIKRSQVKVNKDNTGTAEFKFLN